MDFDFEAEIDAKDYVRAASLKADGATSAESAAFRGTRTVCRHWLRNLCMKGDKCDYLHQYDPNRMPECMFWLKFGKCTDPECVFRHVAASERPECQRYRLGFCKFGPLCRSRHDRMPKDKIAEVLPDWFLDALLVNSRLIPRADEVQLSELRGRNGTDRRVSNASIAPSSEQGAIPGLPPPVHGKCRYFVMRSMNVKNVLISASKGIWATGGGNSQKLRQGFREVDHVILIFAASESRSFLGYARMVAEPDSQLFPGIWGEFSSRLSASFKVQWLKQCEVQLASADHIRLPQPDDLPVRRCRDGQELPASVGERLCRFLGQQPDEDLLKGSELEFEPRVSYEHLALQDGPSKPEAPLALEDDTKEFLPVPEGPARPRPAPVPLGTFQREAKEGKAVHGISVSVGKALASGSSSLLAAMAEELPPEPADPGWRTPVDHRLPPPEWAHMYPPPPGPPGYFHPPAFHHPAHPYGYGPPRGAMGMPPPGSFEAPGVWSGERSHFAQPPTSWEGASGSMPTAGPGRERSRSHRHRRRRRT